MSNEVKIQRFFPLDSERLFEYFMKPELQEKWAAPNGMKLRLPKFEARTGGEYRYEHTDSKGGVWSCEGRFEEVIPNEKIVQIDRFIKNPEGKIISENVKCSIEFEPKFGGTEIHLLSTGFQDETQSNECLEGWTQSFDKLSQFVNQESGFSASGSTPENEQDIRG